MKKIKLVKVFIASPGDVSAQRNDIETFIHEWNNEHTDYTNTILMPIRWESNSISEYRNNTTGQTIINQQIVSDSDLMIALFGHTLGTPVNNSKSGTVDEIRFFNDKIGKRVGIFFLDENVPQKYIKEFQEVEKFRKSLETENKGLYSTYSEKRIKQFLTKEVQKILDAEKKMSVSPKRFRLNRNKPQINKLVQSGQLNLFDKIQFDDDERLLLIFSVEECVQKFSISPETVAKIRKWENKNKLDSYLSERYYDTLDKLLGAGIMKKEINDENGYSVFYCIERQKKIEIKECLEANAAKINGIKLKKIDQRVVQKNDNSLPF